MENINNLHKVKITNSLLSAGFSSPISSQWPRVGPMRISTHWTGPGFQINFMFDVITY